MPRSRKSCGWKRWAASWCAWPCQRKTDALALGAIKKRIHIPLIADIHYDPKLAMLAIEQGVDGVRINPGNLLHGHESFIAIVEAAKEAGIAMRIGVNSGSIDALERGPADAQGQREAARRRHVRQERSR